MEETREQQRLYRFMQFCIYLSLFTEILLFVWIRLDWSYPLVSSYHLDGFAAKLLRLPFYQELLYSKLFTLLLICMVCVGTLSKKQKDLKPSSQIIYPLVTGLLCFFGSLWCYNHRSQAVWMGMSWPVMVYMAASFAGTLLIHVSMDNISKVISSGLGKDKWNVEGESFMQRTTPGKGKYTVNIPMLFYFKNQVRKGFIVFENIFRGILLFAVQGGGKTWGIVNPFIRQLMAKEFSLCIYDFKFPDLAQVAYHHYLLGKQRGRLKDHGFYVLNMTELEKSCRINPWRADYIKTLADASETAEGLVEALKKGEKSSGSDQFFTQSAVNFLAACIYFFSRHDLGRYSSVPHVLSFLNLSYEQIFRTLFSEPELSSLLSPFETAYRAKAYDQLEGQVGTLKIFISRMATKETFWIFSGDDFELKINDPRASGILVLANDPGTQNINSTCYSVVINRMMRLINTKGNRPCGLIIDELSTLMVMKLDNFLALCRQNMICVLMALQELPQFRQQYGKDTAATICAVVGNVLSGAVRSKESLEWLERLFGKVKQQSESLSIDRNKTSVSLSERLEPLIPAGKIAALKAGEFVGILAGVARQGYSGKYDTSAIHCKVNLDAKVIAAEEKGYVPLPEYYDFGGNKQQVLTENYLRIGREVLEIVQCFADAGQAAASGKQGYGI